MGTHLVHITNTAANIRSDRVESKCNWFDRWWPHDCMVGTAHQIGADKRPKLYFNPNAMRHFEYVDEPNVKCAFTWAHLGYAQCAIWRRRFSFMKKIQENCMRAPCTAQSRPRLSHRIALRLYEFQSLPNNSYIIAYPASSAHKVKLWRPDDFSHVQFC